MVRGLGVSALNPKGLLIFLALLPQFTNPRWSWPLTAQLGLLGLVFAASCGAFYLGLGSAARKILAARPAAARAVTRFSGAAMVVIGALCSSGTDPRACGGLDEPHQVIDVRLELGVPVRRRVEPADQGLVPGQRRVAQLTSADPDVGSPRAKRPPTSEAP